MELLTLLKDILVALYGYLKFWILVDHWEEAVILRNGKYLKSLGPGLYGKRMFTEYALTANVKTDTMDVTPISITTLDGKTVSIGVVLEFKVVDVKKFLVDHNDSPSNMTDLVRGELSSIIEDVDWTTIRKKGTRTKLKNNLKESFDLMGVSIEHLNFTDKCQTFALSHFNGVPKEKKASVSLQ